MGSLDSPEEDREDTAEIDTNKWRRERAKYVEAQGQCELKIDFPVVWEA